MDKLVAALVRIVLLVIMAGNLLAYSATSFYVCGVARNFRQNISPGL
jgi:hypothetical protein